MKYRLVHIMELVFDTIENIVGKGENAGFSFFHNVPKGLLV